MVLSAVLAFVSLTLVGIFERSFMSALFGGWAVNGILAIAAVRMTSFRIRGTIIWVIAAAIVSEMFSRLPFGAAAGGVMFGLVSIRLLLFYVLSHRQTIARAICLIAGIFSAVGVSALLAIILKLFVPDGGSINLADTTVAVLAKASLTAAFALALLFAAVPIERRWRWIFGRGDKNIFEDA